MAAAEFAWQRCHRSRRSSRDSGTTPSRFSCWRSMTFMETWSRLAGSNGLIGSVEAGGAEYFATHLATLAARNPNTLIVSAGDLIGASPLLSGMFHDEPTIEALNAMGLDVASVGNHEFDNGWRELLRMQNGGCHPVDGCQDDTPFTGAAFQYLAANVVADARKSRTHWSTAAALRDQRSRRRPHRLHRHDAERNASARAGCRCRWPDDSSLKRRPRIRGCAC